MAKEQGGWLLAKTLYDMGVRDIFTLAGGHINPIYKACADLGIRLIDTHHEQGAAMAADAYGRVTRRPGVCLVTAGPGLVPGQSRLLTPATLILLRISHTLADTTEAMHSFSMNFSKSNA